MRQPALIFDFGNVLAFFDYRRAMERLGAPVGLSGRQVMDQLHAGSFLDDLKSYERGETTAAEFARAVAGGLGLDLDADAFARAWGDIFELNESIAPLIRELKAAGYRLVLGSNTNDIHAAHFRRQFDEVLGQFDALILSYEVGHSKPSPEFYHACVAAAGLPADQCIFIDDLPENIEGAQQAGLNGLVYQDTPGLRRDLARLGVAVDTAC